MILDYNNNMIRDTTIITALSLISICKYSNKVKKHNQF